MKEMYWGGMKNNFHEKIIGILLHVYQCAVEKKTGDVVISTVDFDMEDTNEEELLFDYIVEKILLGRLKICSSYKIYAEEGHNHYVLRINYLELVKLFELLKFRINGNQAFIKLGLVSVVAKNVTKADLLFTHQQYPDKRFRVFKESRVNSATLREVMIRSLLLTDELIDTSVFEMRKYSLEALKGIERPDYLPPDIDFSDIDSKKFSDYSRLFTPAFKKIYQLFIKPSQENDCFLFRPALSFSQYMNHMSTEKHEQFLDSLKSSEHR